MKGIIVQKILLNDHELERKINSFLQRRNEAVFQ